MTIPRWLVYPALLVLPGVLVAVHPREVEEGYAGAAAAARAGEAEPGEVALPPAEHPRLVVLGIDGLDPEILAEVIEAYPERMENFAWLAEQHGIRSLGTSNPPQSPVAWSSFITGLDPGGHGVFDFIHRDPVSRAPLPSTTTADEPGEIPLPGRFKIPTGGETESNRSGRAFWSYLREAEIPSFIWRIPANVPIEPAFGLSFPGMFTPTLDSAYGECTFYTTDPDKKASIDYDKVELLREYDGKIQASIQGPPRMFEEGDPKSRAALTFYVDRESECVAIDGGGETVILEPGQWSEFVTLAFDQAPADLGSLDMTGMARFYLRGIEPHVEIYASPVNIDPFAPVMPVSAPGDASAELAAEIGRYYTQGMAEDVNAVKKEILSPAEFYAQSDLVYRERCRMLEYALDRYLASDGGFLFFYYSTVDLSCHMLWKHSDPDHPAHDAEFAASDSSRWTKRPGSTWKEVVADLYMKMDPVLGRLRERLGDDVPLVVMSDHGFAPYWRKVSLNTWLLENGYLVLNEDVEWPSPKGAAIPNVYTALDGDELVSSVDWSRTRAYGVGFNTLYLNLEGREAGGIVEPSERDALLAEIAEKLLAWEDPENGRKVVLRCDRGDEIYSGARIGEAPDLLVGFDLGYENSDESTLGKIPPRSLWDNLGGAFNGSHLIAPELVAGSLLSNVPVREGDHSLEDLAVEILDFYGLEPGEGMEGRPVLER